ncbi:MAG TPA: hypothetical protein VKU41_27715, partial [Polyangiaceae bacterium]|nr:hypothetical protein [Polyangiaceae bacterium]
TLDPQMFNATLPLELSAHALSGDLSGVQHVMARMEPLTRRSYAWRAYAELAHAQFQQLRGDLEAARASFERCIGMAAPDPGGQQRPLFVWLAAAGGYVETLVALGRHDEARAYGERTLAASRALGIGLASHDLCRALALAEAKLGAFAPAIARLEALIEQQQAYATQGLSLGASYEARARIAIWQGDDEALERYGNLTAREYRHGRGSALGARWERLMAEARRGMNRELPNLTDFDTTRTGTRDATTTDRIVRTLQGASSAAERAERALRILCEDRSAKTGYLYLAGDAGLTLSALRGSDGPPEGLSKYAREYFEQTAAGNGDSTQALTATQMASAWTAQAFFRDTAGVEHHAVLMTFLDEREARYVGVAVLAGDAASRDPQGGAALVAALSAQLDPVRRPVLSPSAARPA